MAQFLINKAVKAEIHAVSKAGSDFNKNYKKVDRGNILGCQTAVSYEGQIRSISKLLALYAQLVQKDTSDITGYVIHSTAMDQLLSQKF